MIVHDKCFEKKIKPGREIRIVRGVAILLDGQRRLHRSGDIET